jgi:hypothetical protein
MSRDTHISRTLNCLAGSPNMSGASTPSGRFSQQYGYQSSLTPPSLVSGQESAHATTRTCKCTHQHKHTYAQHAIHAFSHNTHTHFYTHSHIHTHALMRTQTHAFALMRTIHNQAVYGKFDHFAERNICTIAGLYVHARTQDTVCSIMLIAELYINAGNTTQLTCTHMCMGCKSLSLFLCVPRALDIMIKDAQYTVQDPSSLQGNGEHPIQNTKDIRTGSSRGVCTSSMQQVCASV